MRYLLCTLLISVGATFAQTPRPPGPGDVVVQNDAGGYARFQLSWPNGTPVAPPVCIEQGTSLVFFRSVLPQNKAEPLSIELDNKCSGSQTNWKMIAPNIVIYNPQTADTTEYNFNCHQNNCTPGTSSLLGKHSKVVVVK